MSGRVLELFAGCGGAALGLKRAGWEHVACIERNPAAAATLRAAGFPTLEADVRNVDYSPFRGIDLVWASPPCQAGSIAGPRGGAEDDRDGWPWTLDVLDAVTPTWFLAENVLGWTFHSRECRTGQSSARCVGCYWQGRVVPMIRRRFAFVGWWLLDAANYGTPQHRRRVLLWAGPMPLSAEPPPPTHVNPLDHDQIARGMEPWTTLREAIGESLLDPRTCDRRRCYPCDGSHGRACSEPWRLDRPAPTVTTTEEKGTRAHAPEWGLHGGPDRSSDTAFLVAGVRRIDVKEGLVLQGLPPTWPLSGNRHDQYVQVGNAVPPQLSEAGARAVAIGHQVDAALVREGVDRGELARVIVESGLSIPIHL